MLIREFINARLSDGLLSLVVPRLAGDAVRRTMLISTEVNSFLTGPWDSEVSERKANRLRADLEGFVSGEWISICMTPRTAETAYMARLHPVGNGLWDIRSRDPRPGVRVVGGFTEPDVFVGLVWDYRKNLRTENEWEMIIQRCQQQWRRLFPDLQPHTGQHAHDFISEHFLLE
jgi:hypothetical protein